MNARGAIHVATLAVALLIAIGCAIVPSAYRLDLWKTAWVVSEVDGTPLPGTTSITFNEDEVENKATVRTPCGTRQVDWDLDTDGNEISLGDARLIEQLDCTSEQQAADAAFFAALEGVEEWTVQDDNHVQFSGTKDLSLVRQP